MLSKGYEICYFVSKRTWYMSTVNKSLSFGIVLSNQNLNCLTNENIKMGNVLFLLICSTQILHTNWLSSSEVKNYTLILVFLHEQ